MTADEYIINELEKTKAELEELKTLFGNCVESHDALVDEYTRLVDFFAKGAEYRVSTSGEKYITFDSVWSKYKPEDFKYICSILNNHIPDGYADIEETDD